MQGFVQTAEETYQGPKLPFGAALESAPAGTGMMQPTNVIEPINTVGDGATPSPSAAAPTAPASAPAPTPQQEQQQFVDEWAKDPTGDAPVRTWLDPSARQTADGQFLAAWHDTTVQGDSSTPGPAHQVAQVAAPAPTPAPTPAPAPAVDPEEEALRAEWQATAPPYGFEAWKVLKKTGAYVNPMLDNAGPGNGS